MNPIDQAFWATMEQKYPVAMQKFRTWIDQYKARVNWDSLFGNNIDPVHYVPRQIKFHDIPFEMQTGIIVRYQMEVEGLVKEGELIASASHSLEQLLKATNN